MKPVSGVRFSVLGSVMIGALALTPAFGQTDDRYTKFSAAFATLSADKVAAMYDDEAFYLGSSGNIIRGRDAIRDRFESSFQSLRQHRHRRSITFDLVSQTAGGVVRADVGYYTITTTGPDGNVESFRGKFAKVWTLGRDGAWRIRSDSFSEAPFDE